MKIEIPISPDAMSFWNGILSQIRNDKHSIGMKIKESNPVGVKYPPDLEADPKEYPCEISGLRTGPFSCKLLVEANVPEDTLKRMAEMHRQFDIILEAWISSEEIHDQLTERKENE